MKPQISINIGVFGVMCLEPPGAAAIAHFLEMAPAPLSFPEHNPLLALNSIKVALTSHLFLYLLLFIDFLLAL